MIKLYDRIPNLRFLIFDLDGTLLNEEKTIEPIVIEKLHTYFERGIRTILASGRHYREVTGFIDLIGEEKILATVCCDGLYAFAPNGKSLYMGDHLAENDVKRVMRNLGLRKCAVITDKVDYEVCANKLFTRVNRIKNNIRKNDVDCLYIRELSQDSIQPIEKILFKFCKMDTKDLVESMLEEYTIHVYRSGICECFHKGVNKYNMISRLMKDYGVMKNEVAYFGDEINDVECFANLEYCVAIDTAPDIIKKQAMGIVHSVADAL